jgi:hypothetical protein
MIAQKMEWGMNLSLIALSLMSCAVSVFDTAFFDTIFSAEDGPVEWLTAIGLFTAAGCQVFMFTKHHYVFPRYLGAAFFALLLFLGAGEEISWGQRIFHISSSDFFLAHNAQSETNLHNLVVGDIKLNKLVFGQLLTVALLFYYIILPIAYNRFAQLKSFIFLSGWPIPGLRHSAFFILAYLLVFLIPSERKWEIAELLLACSAMIIVLSQPQITPTDQ